MTERKLVPTAVTPGTYGASGYSVELDIDAYGRVTRATVHSIPGGSITRSDLPIAGNSSNPTDPGVLNRGACFADGVTIKVIGNGMLQVQTLTSISSAPAYLGQMAVVGGQPYVAIGTASPADWALISLSAGPGGIEP